MKRKPISNIYGYIYITTNLINKHQYLGKHKWSQPCIDSRYYGSGMLLQEALRKYGKSSFVVEIIDWANTKDELNQLEKYYIQHLRECGVELYYNISIGGDGGSHYYDSLTQEQRTELGRRISEGRLNMPEDKKAIFREKLSKLASTRIGNKNPNYGNRWSEEQKKQASVRIKRRMEDPLIKSKLSALASTRTGSKNPNYGNKWSEEQRKTASETSKKFMFEHPELRQKLRDMATQQIGERNPFYGKRHSEQSKQKMREHSNNSGINNGRCRPVVQLSASGEFIRELPYMNAFNQLGFDSGNIRECCKGRKKQYKGFKWMYKEDYELK